MTATPAALIGDPFYGIPYFAHKEFDSPDAPGSGKKMQRRFVVMLFNARVYFAKPIRVNHGFRTRTYSSILRRRGYAVVKNSAHELGLAADLDAPEADIVNLVRSLFMAGFRRFGVMATALHVDNDDDRPSPAVWGYTNTPSARLARVRLLVAELVAEGVRENENRLLAKIDALKKEAQELGFTINVTYVNTKK